MSTSSISVREISSTETQEWDAFVRSRPDGTFFHLMGWKHAIESGCGHRCYYLAASQGSRIVGILPTTFVSSPLFGRALISNGFCVQGGPLVETPEAAAALQDAAEEICRDHRAAYFECRGNPSSDKPEWRAQEETYAYFRKTISHDHEANLKAVPRKQRAMIRKAEKNGLTSVVDDGTDRLWRIYAESVRNLGTPVFPRRFFEDLHEVFKDAVQVVTVEHDGMPVASVMSFRLGNRIIPYYGGGVADARRLAANDFMYWEVMRRAADAGCEEFDFGRSKVGTGAYAFKKNWGFNPEPMIYWFRLFTEKNIPEKNPLNPKYRLAIAAWKRLPLCVANSIGPKVARDLA